MTEEECASAANNYDYLKPRHREFIIADPVTKDPQTHKPSKPLTKVTKLPLVTSTGSVTTTMSSRKWSPALVTLALLSFAGGLGYFAWTQGLASVFQQWFTHHPYRPSTSTIGDATMEPTMALISADANALDGSADPQDLTDDVANSPSQVKIRSQHVRLGPFDENEL